MRRYSLSLLGSVVIFSILIGCSPKIVPTPPPAPTLAASAPAAILAVASSPEDAAWAKVVQDAKNERSLVIYGATPFANAGREIIAAFSARYGIRVDLALVAGRQLPEKLMVERAIGKPIADVIQTGISTGTEVVLGGLAERTVDTLPALRDRSVFYFDPVYGPEQQIIAFSYTILGTAVNTNLVKPDEIKSWYDILNPKWKGQIAMLDPRSTGSGLNLFSTLTYHKVLDYDYFRKLAQQKPALWPGATRELYLMTGRGEYAILFGAGQNTVAPLIMEGAPLKVLAMEEGNTAQVEPVLLAKDAPHPNAARLFINWLLMPEGQEAYAKTVGSMPLIKGISDFTPENVRIIPKKIWNRTWEAAEQSNKDLKSGLTEQIFGKK